MLRVRRAGLLASVALLVAGLVAPGAAVAEAPARAPAHPAHPAPAHPAHPPAQPTAASAPPPPHAPAPTTPRPGQAPRGGPKKPKGKAKPRREPPIPKGYANTVRAWHTPAPGRAPVLDAHGRPMLTLFALNTTERVSLPALTDAGGFAASDLDAAAHLLRDPRTGNEHPVDPALLDAVYKIARHFSAQEVRVISGYRTPKPGGHSNHGRGRAMDLIVPGATDEDVAKLAREAGYSGVGVYPVSGFVHVDIRPRSYFWIDTSGPGRRSRLRGVLADVAAKADSAAAARGARPVRPFSLLPDVDAALRAEGGQSAEPMHEEDEDDAETPGASGAAGAAGAAGEEG